LAEIVYKSSVARDLKRLDKTKARLLLEQLEDSLRRDPEAGEPLKWEFRGLYKLRFGEYRVIFTKTDDRILVLRIGHRSKVYGA